MSENTATHRHEWVPIELTQFGTPGTTLAGYLYLACACGAYTYKPAFYVPTQEFVP